MCYVTKKGAGRIGEKKYLTITEFAKTVGVARITVYRRIERGEIKAYKKKGAPGVQIPIREVEKYALVEYMPKDKQRN